MDAQVSAGLRREPRGSSEVGAHVLPLQASSLEVLALYRTPPSSGGVQGVVRESVMREAGLAAAAEREARERLTETGSAARVDEREVRERLRAVEVEVSDWAAEAATLMSERPTADESEVSERLKEAEREVSDWAEERERAESACEDVAETAARDVLKDEAREASEDCSEESPLAPAALTAEMLVARAGRAAAVVASSTALRAEREAMRDCWAAWVAVALTQKDDTLAERRAREDEREAEREARDEEEEREMDAAAAERLSDEACRPATAALCDERAGSAVVSSDPARADSEATSEAREDTEAAVAADSELSAV